MKLFRSLTEIDEALRGGAVTIGNFDGVHRGHARIVNELRALAKKHAGPAIVFTFDPHPVRLLRPELTPPPLTWTSRKAMLLEELGVDATVVYPTDRALLNLTAEEFFQQIILDALGAKALVEGPNFAFGKGREGSIAVLAELCKRHQMELQVVEPLLESEDYVSSSRIRNAIAEGDVDTASSQLTHPYRVRGMVTHGMNRGSEIGFPTANLDAIDTLIPAPGVYAGVARTDLGALPAAIHIGGNPTFQEDDQKFEVHLIDFEGNLYGQVMEVDLLSRLRATTTFESVDALTGQLQRDVQTARELATSYLSSLDA
tara:strand:+ start:15087 stop:16031 length:945 start_codon:yes stop_codon:yes gene_type:complete